jgi:uncharacterized phage protein (TIGR02216 family)
MKTFGAAARRLAGAAAMLLAWRPAEFWAATPAELAAALGWDEEAGEPPRREEIDALMARFPDQ